VAAAKEAAKKAKATANKAKAKPSTKK
jgi:hypothetical protein